MAAEQKTLPTGASVDDFLAAVEPKTRRSDALVLAEIMARITEQPPVMWGPSIVGYGQYRYTYDSGHSGTFFRTGFSPRKTQLSVYILPGLKGHESLLARLGKHKTGAGCLYINKLADVDLDVLEELIAAGYARIAQLYGAPEA
jgi:hypothetical protein